MKYNLIVAEPGKEPVPYELNADRIGLGRGPENQIHVPSEFVSHTHLEFHHVDDGVAIEDLGSKNGTRVNGQPFQGKRTLRDGDRILIGECVAAHLLLLPDDAAPVEAAPKGDEAKHKAAAAYTTLDRKLQDLETHIESKQTEADQLTDKISELSDQIEAKRKEYVELEASVEALRDQLESKREAAGDNATEEVASEIAAIEKDLLKQTQKITVLKTDLDKREAEISELQLTAKVQVASPVAEKPAAAKPDKPAVPAAAPLAVKTDKPPTPAAAPAEVKTDKPPTPAAAPVAPAEVKSAEPPTPAATPPAVKLAKAAAPAAVPPMVKSEKPPTPAAAPVAVKPAQADNPPAPTPVTIVQPNTPADSTASPAVPMIPQVKPAGATAGAAPPPPPPAVAKASKASVTAVAPKPGTPPAAGTPAAPTVKLNTAKADQPKKPLQIPKRPK